MPRRDEKNASDVRRGATPAVLEPRALWIASASITLFILLFFAPLFFEGRTFQTVDHLAYEAQKPYLAEVAREETGLWRWFPAWNPYVFSGMPAYGSLLAQPHVNIMSRLFGFIPEIHRMAFYYLLMGLGVFALFRRWRLGLAAALYGAVAYVFSTQVITLVMFGHHLKLTTLVFLPLVLLATDALWSRPGLLWTTVLAAASGVMLLVGHFQIAFYALAACGLLMVVRSVAAVRGATTPVPALVSRWGLWIVAIAWGLALSAVLTLPVLEYSASSIRASVDSGLDYEYATNWSLHPAELFTALIPSFFGTGGHTYWGWMPFTDFPFFFGTATLLLAILALALWPRDLTHRFLALLLLFGLLLSFGKFLPLLYGPFFNFVPYFKTFRVPSMSMVLTGLALVGLAASAVHRLSLPTPAVETTRVRRTLFRVGLGMGGLILVATILAASGILNIDVAKRFTGLAMPAIQAESLDQLDGPTAALIQASKEQAIVALRLSVKGGILALVFLSLAYGLLSATLRGALPARFLGYGILLLTLIDLWRVAMPVAPWKTVGPLSDPFARDGVVDYLAQQPAPFRVLPFTDRGVGSNWFAWHKTSSLLGYSPAKLGLYEDLIDDDGAMGIRRAIAVGNFNLASMLNAVYIVSNAGLDHPAVDMIQETKPVIQRNRQAMPRLWFVDSYRVITDRSEHLAAVARSEWDPAREAILFESVGSIDPARGSHAEIVKQTTRTLTADVTSTGNGLLVVSEIYYQPGWRAELDGRDVPIWQANYALRAVRVPKGQHRLTMTFEPPAVRTGLMVTGVSALGLLLVGGFLTMRAIRERRLA